MKPSVLFITKVYFLDAALEFIDEVKDYVKLDVLIEIDPASKHANILKVDKLPQNGTFFAPEQILDQLSYSHFKKYIEKCNSFQFFIHQNPRSISVSSIKKSMILDNYLRQIKPDFVHFDDVSLRLIGLTYLRNFKRPKLILNVHDPIQHSGEKNKKILFTRKRFYPRVYKFVTFSKYSKLLFENEYGKKKKCVSFRLKPYLFFRNFMNTQPVKKEYFTFVGRVSEYKGVDLFLEAIKLLNFNFPDAKYCIAGIPVNNSLANKLKTEYNFPNVEFKFRHIENEEMVQLIQRSKAIVCPYKDATQSGVVMTAIALDTKLIVTDQGGLPEYILDESIGTVCKANPDSIVEAIENFMSIDNSNNQKIDHNFEITESKILSLYN